MLNTVYLLTGSNMGDSRACLEKAADLLGEVAGRVVERSPVYRTAPWGYTDQQDFYNQVLCLETALTPEGLLKAILEAEAMLGRRREEKWGPRIIDIDILFYGNRVVESSRLHIPHPMLHLRRFTLAPLNDLAPGLVHPVLNKTVSQLLDECPDQGLVEKL